MVEGSALGVAGAHEHGVVRVGLATDGNGVRGDFEAPMDALFGFERLPETVDERATVVARLATLRENAGRLLRLPEGLECRVEEVVLEDVEAFEGAAADAGDAATDHEHADGEEGHEDDHDHGDDAHDHEGEGDGDHDHDHQDADDHDAEDAHDHDGQEGDHAEAHLTVTWSCSAPVEGSEATLDLSLGFPNAEFADLTVLSAGGQGAARVPASASFRF